MSVCQPAFKIRSRQNEEVDRASSDRSEAEKENLYKLSILRLAYDYRVQTDEIWVL